MSSHEVRHQVEIFSLAIPLLSHCVHTEFNRWAAAIFSRMSFGWLWMYAHCHAIKQNRHHCFRLHEIHERWTTAINDPSVCQSVTRVGCAKTAGDFWGHPQEAHGVPIPHSKGNGVQCSLCRITLATCSIHRCLHVSWRASVIPRDSACES